MLATFRKNLDQLSAIERVTTWVRARFALGDGDTIMVTELACVVPGCPPVETVIAFWTADTRRYHLKVFKPVTAVTEDDLPPAWMKRELAVPEDFECSCC